MRYMLALLIGLLGIAALVLGEADDSPGLQLVGVAIVAGSVVTGMRERRRGGALS